MNSYIVYIIGIHCLPLVLIAFPESGVM